MKSLLKKYNNMKYRYKLTNLLVVVSLVPMTVLALYSHSRMSSLVRKNEMEDMYSILEQTRENIDGQSMKRIHTFCNYKGHSQIFGLHGCGNTGFQIFGNCVIL